MWVQRKIIGKLHGDKVFDFDASIGLKMLQDCVDHFGCDHPFTALVPDLSGDVDPGMDVTLVCTEHQLWAPKCGRGEGKTGTVVLVFQCAAASAFRKPACIGSCVCLRVRVQPACFRRRHVQLGAVREGLFLLAVPVQRRGWPRRV